MAGGIRGGLLAAAVVAMVVFVVAPAGAYTPVERPSPIDTDRTVAVGETNGTAAESTPVSGNVRELLAAARAGDTDPQFVTRSDTGLRVAVTVEAASGSEDDVAERLKRHGSVTARFGSAIDATLPPDAIEAIAASPAVSSIRRPAPVVGSHQGVTVSQGLSSSNVSDELHAAGVNGSNVTVAVVDTGFNVTNDEIDHHVAGFRDFEGDGMDNASGLHGTAVAELVVDVAPNVSLLLYEVETSTGMGAAIEHVTQNTSTDVASMSLGLLTGPFDGTSEIDAAIENSVDDGTSWFVSSGNYADDQHYNATWRDDDGDGWMNVPASGETVEVEAEDGFEVYVSWSGDGASSQNYDVYLNDSETGAIVDVSNTTQDGFRRPVEKVRADTNGTYTLAIERVDASGTADFDLFATDGTTLSPSTAARSVARPATAESAIAVGAVDHETLGLAAFSSRGPTVDGRTKPDLVGPSGVSTSTYDGVFSGTSAATPHAAGVAALVLDGTDKSIKPPEVRASLAESATPLAEAVPNNRTGYGLVNATGAVTAARSKAGLIGLSVTDLRAPSVATVGETVTVNATITNNDDTPRTDTLTYVFDGTVERNRSVSLDGGESTEERFEIPTDAVTPGTYEHGIRIGKQSRTEEVDLRQPATFNLFAIDAPSAAVVGETVRMNAIVENVGGVEGEVAVGYLFDGSVVETRNVSIPGGTSERIEFEIATDDIAPETYTHEVSVAGSSRGVNITIQQPATFELTDFDAPAVVESGGTVPVNVTVRNVGDVAGLTAVEYVFDGAVVRNRSVSLDGGNSTVVRFEVAPDAAPGAYDHGVRSAGNNRTAGILLNALPTAAFTVNATEPGVAGTVTFDAAGSDDPDGVVVTYEWDLDGDGAFDDATGAEVETAFASTGEATVSLRVTDDSSGTNTTTTTLTIRATPTSDPTGTETPPDQPEKTTAGGSPGDSDTDGESTDTPGMPGFGPLAALLGLLAFLAFGRRIHRDDR